MQTHTQHTFSTRFIEVEVNDKYETFLIDTGADRTKIRKDFLPDKMREWQFSSNHLAVSSVHLLVWSGRRMDPVAFTLKFKELNELVTLNTCQMK
jgi:predicted aspartyl protease